jgi:hypothetical protein
MTQQLTNPNDFITRQTSRNLTDWDVSGDQSDCERSPSKAHRKVINPCPRCKKFRLSGKIVSDLV